MDAMTDNDDRVTGKWVAEQLRDALKKINAIATTGNDTLDEVLATAEAALRRVIVAAEKDPN